MNCISKILLTIACILSVYACKAQLVILSQDGLTITADTVLMEREKKHDAYQINVAVMIPTSQNYFTAHKTGNALQDLYLHQFLKISVTNHSGLLANDKIFSGEPTNLVTTDHSSVYAIPVNPIKESFITHVRTGEVPAITAALLKPLYALQDLSLIRATPEELFAGTSPDARMFLLYDVTDTLLVNRSNVLQFLNHLHKPSQATFSREQFITKQTDTKSDSLSTYITYLDWSGKKAYARINENTFETSSDDLFKNIASLRDLQLKNAEGKNITVRLEHKQLNVLPFDIMYSNDKTFKSPDGGYILKFDTGDGTLKLFKSTTSQVLWTNLTPGTNGISAARLNNQFVVRNMRMPGQKGTGASAGTFLVIRNDGNILICRKDGYAVWQSNTADK